jgi:hypothetical protein
VQPESSVLSEQLKTQVASVQDSNAFKRYLAAQARFHRYSARNVFLILLQMPEATHVAGYTSWQRLGRHVRRGERGITARLAPIRSAMPAKISAPSAPTTCTSRTAWMSVSCASPQLLTTEL